jgi:hypothetical protein
VVYEHGGIYFDWDVYAIRDLKPLRETGYANVVGLEKYGNVGTACYMSVKGYELMRMWLEKEHIVNDSGWVTHVVTLFNKMSRRLSAIPGEVLILAESAFAPSSRELKDMEYLFGSHSEERQPSFLEHTSWDHTPKSSQPTQINPTRGEYHRPGDAKSVWDLQMSSKCGKPITPAHMLCILSAVLVNLYISIILTELQWNTF